MLKTHEDGHLKTKILGIDPGLNNIGFSTFTIDSRSLLIEKIESFSIVIDKLRDNSGLDIEIHGFRNIKPLLLQRFIVDTFIKSNISAVYCEDNYFDPTKPLAYKSLIEAVMSIRNAFYEINPNVSVTMIEALVIKKAIKCTNFRDKLAVKESIKNNKELIESLTCDIEELTEHAIDSIAIGYSGYKTWTDKEN